MSELIFSGFIALLRVAVLVRLNGVISPSRIIPDMFNALNILMERVRQRGVSDLS